MIETGSCLGLEIDPVAGGSLSQCWRSSDSLFGKASAFCGLNRGRRVPQHLKWSRLVPAWGHRMGACSAFSSIGDTWRKPIEPDLHTEPAFFALAYKGPHRCCDAIPPLS